MPQAPESLHDSVMVLSAKLAPEIAEDNAERCQELVAQDMRAELLKALVSLESVDCRRLRFGLLRRVVVADGCRNHSECGQP